MNEIKKYPLNSNQDNNSETNKETTKVNEQLNFDDSKKIGLKLAEELEKNNFHPVVIFGSSNSGKSSLLCSLLSHFQHDNKSGIGIYLEEPVISLRDTYGKESYQQALVFFNQYIQEFIAGKAVMATKTAHPFFIPVKIIPPDNKPEIKLAFMESNGEWYKPHRESGVFFQPLKQQISDFLASFPNGISFIYVAPISQINEISDHENQDESEKNKTEMADADSALDGALRSYIKVRSFKENDNHIFILSKWDKVSFADKPSLREILDDVENNEVEEVANQLYKNGFTQYLNLKLPRNQQKQIMQYSCGVINGQAVIRNNELKASFDKYPTILWNWLYSNATSSEFGELIPSPPKPQKNIIEKFLGFLDWLLHFGREK